MVWVYTFFFLFENITWKFKSTKVKYYIITLTFHVFFFLIFSKKVKLIHQSEFFLNFNRIPHHNKECLTTKTTLTTLTTITLATWCLPLTWCPLTSGEYPRPTCACPLTPWWGCRPTWGIAMATTPTTWVDPAVTWGTRTWGWGWDPRPHFPSAPMG